MFMMDPFGMGFLILYHKWKYFSTVLWQYETVEFFLIAIDTYILII